MQENGNVTRRVILKNVSKSSTFFDVVDGLRKTGEIINIRMCKQKDDEATATVIVEYKTAAEAQSLLSMEIVINGEAIKMELVKQTVKFKNSKKIPKAEEKKSPVSALNEKSKLGKAMPSKPYKSKVYIGNLPENFTAEALNNAIDDKLKNVKTVFLTKDSAVAKKYAFLEFSDEVERNLALGVLERLKQEGVFGDSAAVSPAYPYTQRYKRKPSKPKAFASPTQ